MHITHLYIRLQLETVAAIQLLLIPRIGVVWRLLGPMVSDLLSGRNPDRTGRLLGDMLHKLSLCQR